MKYIRITVDMGDADYISELSEISEKELESIWPIILALRSKNLKSNNFDIQNYNSNAYARRYYVDGGICDEQSYLTFYKLCPCVESGFHSVVKIELFDVSKIEELYHEFR